ncbi:putative cob(I)alamin adenosyltransferase [Candidatus Hodgkinia cicadicola]|uniref:Putative cob(I)alamin adenosyltransferase n=1 Tax=Candidatus Hodgkinia cicadicola TaxID=573658 RepID=A0A097GZW1_9HYPH|nr:putative cob(I)alamin adenosyltransferase [Candidatus Hodgkinia cicadicola]AUG34014.1 putative cob(I)alamin adenosyltransferase [Candidatus Hodgkinia cicadicola]
MPRDLRSHNYIRKGLCVCLYGRGRFKTSACLGFAARSDFRGVSCVSVSVLKLVWGPKAGSGCCVCRFRKTGGGCECIALASYWCIVSKHYWRPVLVVCVFRRATAGLQTQAQCVYAVFAKTEPANGFCGCKEANLVALRCAIFM